ncbi:MAG: MlaE family ABC transporter permease [Shimia sp.]|uniref:MlaE family ABC transporter permease n=1 Tax=Shimia sp. TaxID=1954381 RepID=UPI0040585B07
MSGVSPPFLRDEDAEIHVGGALVTARLGGIEADFDAVGARSGNVTLNLRELTAFDTGGAWMVAALKSRLTQAGSEVEITHALPAYAALLANVETATPERDEEVTQPRSVTAMLDSFGRKVAGAWGGVISFNGFLGETLVCISRLIFRPWRLRWASLVTHMQDAGLNAVPIVALMGFLIGIVLAFQGATQLQRFGAEVFVVELISISVLRELGILLTAIIVAGRSGSAFTASVGSMKVQEEIDAMRTLGLDPIEVLVVPRVLALVLVLPILGFVANLCGLFGGALMSWIDLGVSPGMFLTRLYENTGVWHLVIGMIKAPFFAVVIGVVACWQAFQVRGSSTSVGQRTTASVVQGIFLVIVLDALFSIFFAQLGI